MQSTDSLVDVRARELDVLSQAVIGTDAEGRVVYWNDVAERLYGWTSAEACGRSITDLTPTTLSRGDAERIMESLRAGHYWSGEFPVRRRDGRTFLAHVVDVPVHDDVGNLVGMVGISSDISPIIRLERLALDLSAAATPDAVARVCLEACLDMSAGAAGTFMVLEPDQQCFVTLHSAGYAPEVVARFHSIPLDSPLPVAVAARMREAMFVTSAQEWTSRFPAVAPFSDARTKTWIALPLDVGGRVIGAIAISVRVERPFEPADRELMIAMARVGAVALDRALLFAREQEARRIAETAQSRAEEATRVKSAFLANMSHELRTPLGAIIGYHDLIAAEIFGPLTHDQRTHLQRLRNSATHLLSVINDLLDYSRIEAGREVVRSERATLGQVVQSVSDIVAPLARAKNLELSVRCDPPGAPLQTDTQKLKQIIVNLAGNAVKYTQKGTVRIDCAVDSGTLRVVVADTGVGIAPDHLDHIFEPFWQADDGRTGSTGGTGLGLSVSRSLTALLGGTLRVESEVGRGSTFVLELPVDLGS